MNNEVDSSLMSSYDQEVAEAHKTSEVKSITNHKDIPSSVNDYESLIRKLSEPISSQRGQSLRSQIDLRRISELDLKGTKDPFPSVETNL